jgi:hypothetical protein
LVVLFSAANSRADGVTFNSPTGVIASPHTYTLDGFSIIATAFNGGRLLGKNDGIGEQGIGLTGDPNGQHDPAPPQDRASLSTTSEHNLWPAFERTQRLLRPFFCC